MNLTESVSTSDTVSNFENECETVIESTAESDSET